MALGVAKVNVGLSLRARTTHAGDRLPADAKQRQSALRTTARSSPTRLGPADAAMAFALFGPVVFAEWMRKRGELPAAALRKLAVDRASHGWPIRFAHGAERAVLAVRVPQLGVFAVLVPVRVHRRWWRRLRTTPGHPG